MILSDDKILEYINQKKIIIEPFSKKCLGSNSYDIHLGSKLGIYEDAVLDAKKHNKIKIINIPPEGFVLESTTMYLGVTKEYTETHLHVPFLEGKSSTGRLGIDIHATAGKGDVGFCGYWTLEISAKTPVRIYRDMPIGQLIYYTIEGRVNVLYNQKNTSKYNNRINLPVESMMWKNFPQKPELTKNP